MTKIESVSSCAVSVPLDNVTAFATRTVHERHYLLVKVRGDDGVEGIGFCYAGSAAGALGTVAVRDLLAPVLIGEDPYRVEGLWRRDVPGIDTARARRNGDARAFGPRYRDLGPQRPRRRPVAGPVPGRPRTEPATTSNCRFMTPYLRNFL